MWLEWGRSMTGIYGIFNKDTGKWYVGQAENIEARWAKHKRELKAGTHHSLKLQRSYNRHQLSSFAFIVLEECETSELDPREVFWINEKDSLENGYNMTAGGGGTRGWKMPDAAKEKISKTHKGEKCFWYGKKQPQKANELRRLALLGEKNHNYGKKVSEETKRKLHEAHVGRNPPNKRPVRCIETGAIYESAKAAAIQLGLDHSSITKCCRGSRAVCGGFHWEVVLNGSQ